jgi:hypothetical protein
VIDYYNKQGLLLPNAVIWARLIEDPAYCNIAVDVEQNFMVSTVWEGHERQGEGPGIFETAILRDGVVVQRFRWRDLDSAEKGHAEIVRKSLLREPRPEDLYLEKIIEAERNRVAAGR